MHLFKLDIWPFLGVFWLGAATVTSIVPGESCSLWPRHKAPLFTLIFIVLPWPLPERRGGTGGSFVCSLQYIYSANRLRGCLRSAQAWRLKDSWGGDVGELWVVLTILEIYVRLFKIQRSTQNKLDDLGLFSSTWNEPWPKPLPFQHAG